MSQARTTNAKKNNPFSIAMEAYREKDYKKALLYFNACSPNDIVVKLHKAQCMISLNDVDAAIKFLDSFAQEISEENLDSLCWAYSDAFRGKYKQSTEEKEKNEYAMLALAYLEQYKDKATLHYQCNLAGFYLDIEEYEKAINIAENRLKILETITLDRKNKSLRTILLNVCFKTYSLLNDYSNKNHYASLLLELINKGIEKDDEDIILSLCLLANFAPEKIEDIDFSSIILTRIGLFSKFAIACEKVKQFTLAQEWHLKAIEGDPENWQSLLNYAIFLQKRDEKFAESMSYLTRIIDFDPLTNKDVVPPTKKVLGNAYLSLGIAYNSKKETAPKASDCFEKALELGINRAKVGASRAKGLDNRKTKKEFSRRHDPKHDLYEEGRIYDSTRLERLHGKAPEQVKLVDLSEKEFPSLEIKSKPATPSVPKPITKPKVKLPPGWVALSLPGNSQRKKVASKPLPHEIKNEQKNPSKEEELKNREPIKNNSAEIKTQVIDTVNSEPAKINPPSTETAILAEENHLQGDIEKSNNEIKNAVEGPGIINKNQIVEGSISTVVKENACNPLTFFKRPVVIAATVTAIAATIYAKMSFGSSS